MPAFARLASTVLIGIAANADNLTVGIGYGIKQRRIGWKQNLLIAVVTTSVTLIALAAGRDIRRILPSTLPGPVGGALLLAFAAWSICRDRAGATGPVAAPLARLAGGNPVGLRETLFLAASLSLNNIGLAIAGGIGGIGYAAAAAAIFCASLALLWLGQAISTHATRSKFIPRVLHHPISGNAVLALAGLMMLAGY